MLVATASAVDEKTIVNLSAGKVDLTDIKSGISISTTVLIDDVKFTPSIEKTEGSTLVWGTNEKYLLFLDDPVVKFSYETNDTILKETIVLKEKKDLKFPLTLEKGTIITPMGDGSFIIVKEGAGYDDTGILVNKPFGIDASGRYVPMEYKYDGNNLILQYEYARELNKSSIEKLPVYDNYDIQYPLTIDPTYTSQYPIAYSDTYVKATTTYTPTFQTYYAVDPSKSLTGSAEAGVAWMSLYVEVEQRFHIDLGSAKTIKQVMYANYHDSGATTDSGVKTFTLWGSNSSSSFADVNYSTDTGWTQLTTNISQFAQHAASDTEDLHYINVTNNIAYRYYAFKFADGWGTATLAFRRIELQTEDVAAAPVASFTADKATGNNTDLLTLTDTSTNTPTAWNWSFQNITGNNTQVWFSTTQNPSQIFGMGNYSIKLNASNAVGYNNSAQTTFFNVTPSATFSPFFTYGDGYISINQSHTVILWNATGARTPFNATGNASTIDYVVVGGGGGGGYRYGTGGGGAGAFWEGTLTGLSGSQSVTVGAGGAEAGSAVSGDSGGNSVFGSVTANGGSGGGSRTATVSLVLQGGSAGGGGSPAAAGTGASNTTNQAGHGNDGGTGLYSTSTNYQGGGGGGAFTTGTNAASNKGGNAGNASFTDITGTRLTLAGGGGGGTYSSTAGNRGLGGGNLTTGVKVGGDGAYRTTAGTDPAASTGSGGGGAGSSASTGTSGSGGIVIIRFLNSGGSPPAALPIPSFTTNITSGVFTLPVLFNSTSDVKTPTAWNWSFGGTWWNTTTAAASNATWNFSTGGKYAVTLGVLNSSGYNTSSSTTISVYNVTKPFLNVNTTSGVQNVVVGAFSNGTLNATWWNWSFGNGSWANGTGAITNQTITYSTGGVFTLGLYTSDAGYGSASNTTTITVYNKTVSGFTANSTSGTFPLAVGYNVTIPADNASFWNWSFGDGTYQNTTQNSSKLYTSAGTYTVNLTTGNGFYNNVTIRASYITVTAPPAAPVTITSNVTAGVYPLIVGFNDTTQWLSTTSYNWSLNGSWQNGTTQNASVTYSTGGKYDVFLKKTNSSYTNTSNYITISVYNQTKSIFNTNTSSGLYNLTVLANASGTLNATWWNWSFSNGSWFNGTGYITNVTNLYTTGGNYSISLTTSNAGYGTSTNTTYINVWNRTVSGFTANITTGYYNLPVLFSVSIPNDNATFWNWSFGNGVYQNTTQNATYTYSNAGNYTINLSAGNAYYTNTTSKSLYITIGAHTTSNITSNATVGWSPLPVQFNGTGLNTTSWNWTFGAANFSNLQNPVYTFTGPSSYTVRLITSNSYTNNTTTITNMITVLPIVPPIANFTYNSSGGIQSAPVQFTSDSFASITAYNWTFGDGNYSTTQNPLFTYNVPGTYSVNLSVTNASGTNWTNKSNIISISQIVLPIANFTSNKTTSLYNFPFMFNDTGSISSITGWNWSYKPSNLLHENAANGTESGYGTGIGAYNSGTSVTSTTTEAWEGTHSIKVITDGTAFNQGVATNLVTYKNSTTYQFSAYVKGNGTIYLTITEFNNGTYIEQSNSGIQTLTTDWQRFNCTRTATVGNAFSMTVITSSNQNTTFYVDGLQFEASPTVSTWHPPGSYTYFGTSRNQSVTFNEAGGWDINLSVTNTSGSNYTMRDVFVTTTTPPLPVANFTANKTYGAIPMPVLFNDTGSKTTITAWNWSFGDGSYSNLQSPVKTYSDIGLYDVFLTLQNASGVNSTSKIGYINTTSVPFISANFAAAPTTAIQSSTSVLFGDNSAGTIDNWSWDFGDGSTSYIQNPSHTYYTTGLYTVKLTVSSTVFGISDVKTRTNYIIVSNSTAPPTYNTSVSQLDLPNSSPQWNWYYYLAVTNKTGPNWEFPIVSFAYGLVYPFTNAFEQVGGNQFGNAFYLILWGLFLIMVYKNSGRVGVVAIMAVLTAGAWSMLAPASSMPWVLCLIAAALASQVITLITKKD